MQHKLHRLWGTSKQAGKQSSLRIVRTCTLHASLVGGREGGGGLRELALHDSGHMPPFRLSGVDDGMHGVSES
jgi:hypothetical protein